MTFLLGAKITASLLFFLQCFMFCDDGEGGFAFYFCLLQLDANGPLVVFLVRLHQNQIDR